MHPVARGPATNGVLPVLSLVALAAGCGASPAGLRVESAVHGLHDKDLRGPDDPTVRGSRALPLAMDEAHTWGTAPGGGVRAIVAGERVVTGADGSVSAAADRLPRAPNAVLELPERLGGGFVFALGSTLLRSDTWLGPTRPWPAPPGNVSQIVAGLDRVYVRTQQGALVAYDGRRGAVVDLGPLPAAPTVGRMAALDAWRAVAIADTRGVLLTLDAGATWRPLRLPFDAADVVPLGDSVAVGGVDESRQVQWWEVRPDGQTGRLPAAPSGAADASAAPPAPDPVARAFGARPLAAAVEDGWPLRDGTAVVARDGALARVRLADGALIEAVADAFPLRPARCHAVSLAARADQRHAPADPGAFGFVCGEPRGRTVVYRWDPAGARLVEMRRFDGPRQVLAFGNGALAARGACADDAEPLPAGDVAWCLMPPGGAWSEMHFRGEEVERARVVVLGDGRVALVRPPRDGDLSTARVTVTDGARSSHAPVTMPAMRADVTRALRVGLWLDGFEERRPGVLGGWVDSGGSVVGVEVGLDGHAEVGPLMRSAGDVFVAGRWGFAWTASRRGIETTDGGMTWTELEMPDPIAPARGVRERACGPIGCLAAGWMRVGWGEPEKVEPKPAPPSGRPPGAQHAPPALALDCEPLAGREPEPKAAPAPRRPPPQLPQPPPRRWAVGVLGSTASSGSDQLPPFYWRAAPGLGADDLGISAEVSSLLERGVRNQPTARLYAWGPRTGDWDQLGRWQIRWLWPYGGWPELRSSAVAPAPWTGIDAARHGLGLLPPPQTSWLLVPGDDADHALLVARRTTSTTSSDVVVLEADRAPLEVRRPGGDPFPDVEGAVRAGGRWYLATLQPASELSATVVWMLDGSGAREVARVPRGGFEGRPALRLARRADGRALGLVVDGQTDRERKGPVRWIVPLDLETGALADPEPLAPIDLSDRRVSSCQGEDGGWVVDLPYPGTVRVHTGPASEATLTQPVARMRVSREKACVERMMGSLEGFAPAPGAQGARSALGRRVGADTRSIEVAAFSARVRYPLRCVMR